MERARKVFYSILISLIAFGFLSLAFFTPKSNDILSSNADVTYDQITNSYPDYLKIETSETSGTEVGQVGNEIFLMRANSFISPTIGTDIIEQGSSNANTDITEQESSNANYAYYPDREGNPKQYYYFTFQNSLSLYYNLTASDIQNGQIGTNLLTQISNGEGGYEQNLITYYTLTYRNDNNTPNATEDDVIASVPPNLSITPQRLDIDFKLNTRESAITRSNNTVTLYQEGCYTLAIDVNYFYTSNGGVSYTNSAQTIYFTFLIFNTDTYFNDAGMPHLAMSSNMQESTVSSDTYSRYYFANYNYAKNTQNDTTTITNFSFDPDKYQININYTDLNSNVKKATIVYTNGEFVQYDENNAVISEDDYFVFTDVDINDIDQSKTGYIFFTDLGSYDISIQYLYKTQGLNGEQIYELPFTELSGDSAINSKRQRIYIYGYQAVFSDYSNPDPATNQPASVELKTYNFENGTFSDSADITGEVNKYIAVNLNPIDTSPNKNNIENTISMQSPSSSQPYTVKGSTDSLQKYALDRINGLNDTEKLSPVSTNQTPIKFLTNATNFVPNASTSSTIFEMTYNSASKGWEVKKDDTNKEISYDFEGFNQNSAGTYLYVIQYTYDYYMSTSGTLQGSYYHYQSFLFIVTNTMPSVTVVDDENFEQIYTSGYTNKGVYILDDSMNNIYDAEVEITLSAQNYNAGSNVYFFQDDNILDLQSYGIYYEKFENVNDVVNGKYGIYIPKNASFANAEFTIKIYSANTDKPSTRTFTIDTSPISDLRATNVEFSSGNSYRILDNLSSYITNQSITMSWAEKASGATTYGYVKYIPLKTINYYSSQSSITTISSLLDFWLNYNSSNPSAQVQATLPVSYKLDIEEGASQSWIEYPNSRSYSSFVTSSYVKSEAGIYILEVYDQAGNSSFEIYMIDNSEPVFVQQTASLDFTSLSLMVNNSSISIPEADPITGEIETQITIKWAKHKAIYLDNLTTSILEESYVPYVYTIGLAQAQQNLTSKLQEFFNYDNQKIINVNDVPAQAVTEEVEGSLTTGIDDYDGYYLVIDINSTAYIKNWNANTFSPQNVSTLSVQFIDEEGKSIDATYRIAIRDSANTKTTGNPTVDYTTYPSSYISFNVSADASKVAVNYIDSNTGKPKTLNVSSFAHTGNLYTKTDEDGSISYSHLQESGYQLDKNLTYKFSYHSPINANNALRVYFVPVAENGSEVDSITMYYYAFVRASKFDSDSNKTYWYYTISETHTETRVIFKASDETVYQPGQEEEAEIAFGDSDRPSAGRYVIVRDYKADSTVDNYDYFRRTITFTVDTNGIITRLEGVSNEEGSASSLESLVGGDIILSMYSNDGYSSLEVSFPSYNEDGLSNGSFYTQGSFTSEKANVAVAVEGNKLPMTLYIPKYKYTTTTYEKETDTNRKYYGVEENQTLSYHGNSRVEYDEVSDRWNVISEGVVIQTFDSQAQAENYLNSNISITEYEIVANITAVATDENGDVITDENGDEVKRYYASSSDNSNGYLTLYETDSSFNVSSNSTPVNYFYLAGIYSVVLYQARNLGETDGFYQLYKFAFEILTQSPEFDLITKDGYQLSPAGDSTVYYTNTDELRVQWEVPTSNYQARIDTKNITINSSPLRTYSANVITEGTIQYFTIDTSYLLANANSYVDITLRFEGDQSYYRSTTKRIYFDRSAPLENIQSLMSKTETATDQAFTLNYQQVYMRRYANQDNTEQTVSAYTDLSTMSYSYSIATGDFRYFSYNVDMSFFNSTLVSTLINASTNRYGTQYIYYKTIPSIDSYTQVDKSSFSQSTYKEITVNGASNLYSGYYEIVERDYAGNMTVYVVYLIQGDVETDPNVDTNAISYINNNNTENISIDSSEITNGMNIYSNSGFEITNYNYMSDPWAMIYVRQSGSSLVKYMKSPWLEENRIWRITFSGSGVSLTETSINEIMQGVQSSSNKHQLMFVNRADGVFNTVYLTIMDASISAQKIEDPNHTSAILNINVPTQAQYASTETAYVFPTKITILQFTTTGSNPYDWNTIYIANQDPYGTWTADNRYESASSYISFTTLSSGTILQIRVNLGANSSSKIRYEIVDNFGNKTVIIQLANEISFNEIVGTSTVYTYTESNGDTTYISDQSIMFQYNNLLYSVKIMNGDGTDITNTLPPPQSQGNNIYSYTFSPSTSTNWDNYFKVEISDIESGEWIRTIHVRLYYKLPYFATSLMQVSSGGIVFQDKDGKPITNYAQTTNETVYFEGRPYTTTGYSITTYSQDVTMFFRDGQSLNYIGQYNYRLEYKYSLYLSRDNGQTWESINSSSSATSGVRISGTGNYIIFAKYDDENIFTNLSKIYRVEILDTESSFYYITLDGLNVEKSDIRYVDANGKEYGSTYLVRLNHNEINHDDLIVYEGEDDGTTIVSRLRIILNPEQNVTCILQTCIPEENEAFVDVFHYTAENDDGQIISQGDFAIIYIRESSDFVSLLTYETPYGTTGSMKSSSSVTVVVDNSAQSSQMRINYSSINGIDANRINIEVLKYFNGDYVEIYPTVYSSGDTSYIYLERAGSYRIKLYDSCTPANVQLFRNGEYLDIILLNSIPFTVSHTETTTDGSETVEETVVTEKIQNAIYNNAVTISLYNLSTYYQAGGYPVISVQRNGYDYTNYTSRNYTYTFSEPGYYSVKFTATSRTTSSDGSQETLPQIREEVYNFTILNPNESRYAFEYTEYQNYYISRILKNGIDITDELAEISNFSTVVIDGRTYLTELNVNYLDKKTGSGRYEVTINTNQTQFTNLIGEEFSFAFWINTATPPLSISVAEGESTTSNITISFNTQNLYDAMGDCYIQVGSQRVEISQSTLPTLSVGYTITISETGTYYVQVYSMSGYLLYSYKVQKTAPLNAFAIIAIVLGVIAAIVIVIITIRLRKRQKVK